MILPTNFPKPNLTKIQSSPIISQPSQSQSSPISPISISSSGPIISLSQSPKLISPSPHPICNKKIHSPIKNAFPLSSFFSYVSISISIQPTLFPLPWLWVSSPPLAPSPPLSPDIPFIKKKSVPHTLKTPSLLPF
jgi:hypothetical protein